jgi:dephospho-CoA kinase
MSAQVVKKRILIGLTGNIASGKSEALSYIKSLGYDVIDSDSIVKDIWKDQFHVLELSRLFSRDLSQIDIKNAFIKDVFSNKALREGLEAYIHPIVYQEIFKKAQLLGDVVIVDVPLLYETKKQSMFDAVILVITDEATQMERLLKRGYEKLHAQARIDAFMPYARKVHLTQYHLNGSEEIKRYHQSIKDVLRKILQQ